MRLMLAALLGASALLATSAAAQDTAQAAAAFIAANDAEGVFEPAPVADDVGELRVRHVGSGMVCAFDPQAPHRIVLFPGLARGEDVACDFREGDAFVTLYATRYEEPTSNAGQLAGAIAQMRQRFGDAQLAPAEILMEITPGQETLPESVHAAFLVSPPDAAPELYTRVSIAMVEGWVIKMRFSRRAADQDAARGAELMAAMVWLETLQNLAPSPTEAEADQAAP